MISSISDLENAALEYGILPFFRNNIKGFSVEEMTAPGMLFGGNDFDGCWEWKGPVLRRRSSAYGKFFKRKAGFVSLELLPYFLKWRRSCGSPEPGSTDEMIYDIITINDRMTSTELRETFVGKPRRRRPDDLPEIEAASLEFTGDRGHKRVSRHSFEGPLQRLQMQGLVCISDFRYKQTRKGEKYGWGVAEYSTPEAIFGTEDIITDLEPHECLDYILEYVSHRWPRVSELQLRTLLRP